MLNVEFVYVPENQPAIHLHLNVEEGATVADVLLASQQHIPFPEDTSYSVGIFSKTVDLNTLVKPGDRIEIYRPLILDPKERRRLRAKK